MVSRMNDSLNVEARKMCDYISWNNNNIFEGRLSISCNISCIEYVLGKNTKLPAMELSELQPFTTVSNKRFQNVKNWTVIKWT